MKIYDQSVGRNSGLILGVVIDPDGQVPETDAQRLREFGNALQQRFISSLGSTKGDGKSFVINLKSPATLNQYVVQEDIQFGERVRSYEIKGKTGQGTWVRLDTGSCIGHKRIGHISDAPSLDQIVLKILQCGAMPHIREFKVF